MGKNAPWLSVPQFGDWDQKGQVPDYSLDFSKIREMRKQNKRDVSRASLGNEEELIATNTANVEPPHNDHHPITIRGTTLQLLEGASSATSTVVRGLMSK
ncbi:hypothetical protein Prudu_017049 [Prunus dulcis]|uniref:RIN4 pathogenic type III effector avirulence factor Avr cleavage site domain-containing protein n=1 Tax=Prunus dulcis TaxID=3755 RepID=A0A4Y1RP40_PRUDU|nr:hypothetical protein Prudu_017049 [Prunus dulcis]